MRSTWYLSSLVFCTFIAYFLLVYNEKLMMGIFPILSLIIYSHWYATYGNLSFVPEMFEGWVSGETLRGIAGIWIGIFIYGNIQYCNTNNFCIKSNKKKLLITILKYIVLISIMYLIYVFASDINDFFKLFLISVLIRLSFYNCYEIHKQYVVKVIYWLGSITYWIFCIHLIVSHILVAYFHYLKLLRCIDHLSNKYHSNCFNMQTNRKQNCIAQKKM